MIKFATALWFAEFTAGSESHSWAEVDGCVTQIWRAGVVVVVLVGKFTSTVGFGFIHSFVDCQKMTEDGFEVSNTLTFPPPTIGRWSWIWIWLMFINWVETKPPGYSHIQAKKMASSLGTELLSCLQKTLEDTGPSSQRGKFTIQVRGLGQPLHRNTCHGLGSLGKHKLSRSWRTRSSHWDELELVTPKANPQKTGEDRGKDLERPESKGSKIQGKFAYICLWRPTTC